MNVVIDTANTVIDRAITPKPLQRLWQTAPSIRGKSLLNPKNMRQFRKRPFEFFAETKRTHGTPFYLFMPGGPSFIFFDEPECIKQTFIKGEPHLYAGKSTKQVIGPLVGNNSLLTLDSKAHLRERKMLLPSFHGDRMKSYAEVMARSVEDYTKDWRSGEVGVYPAMSAATLEVILDAVFGVSGAVKERLRSGITQLLQVAAASVLFLPFMRFNLGKYSPYGRFLAAREAVDKTIYAELDRRRRKQSFGDDICSILMQATYEDGTPVPDDCIRDELLTMLVAGHETSATALSWCLDRLAVEQEWQAKLREEIADLDPAEVKKENAPLLDVFIKEVLRLTPVIPAAGRYVHQDVQIGPYEIPAGTVIGASCVLTHRNESLWEQPLAFCPERFLDTKPNPYQYFPFGGGVRRCIGMAFAFYEIRIMLTSLLQRFTFAKDSPYVAREMRRHITLAPQGDAPVNVRSIT